MAQQIQLRHDTAANWTAANPILATGEVGVETDTTKLKIGNGVGTWGTLTYAGGGGGDALVANPLSQFHSTTSAQLAGVISDATGTGQAVFATSPTLAGVPIAPTAVAGTSTTQIATTAHVFAERTNTATLTGKTLSGASNTFTALPAAGISGVIPIANLATGVPNGTKFIRDDGSLQTVTSGSSTFAALTDAVTATIATTNTSVANAIAAITPNPPITVTAGFTFARATHANRRIGYNAVSVANATFDGTAAFTNGDKIKLLQEGIGAITLLASGVTFNNPRSLPLSTSGVGTFLEAEWDSTMGQLVITSAGTLVTLGLNSFTGAQTFAAGTAALPSMLMAGAATTGFYQVSGNVLGYSLLGALAHEWDGVGNYRIMTPGTGLAVKEGANCKQGAANLTAALAAPVQATPTTVTTGGSIPAGTYYYVVTALNPIGEGIKSNELSITTTGTTSTNTVSWAAVTGATSYRVYRGTTAGGENILFASITGLTLTDTFATSGAGTPPFVDDSSGALVQTTAVTSNSRIFLCGNGDGGVPGYLRVSLRVPGTYFRVKSSSPTDTSVFVYEIFEPA